jgi:asparagine synthase (glutamine-hydrolysing)
MAYEAGIEVLLGGDGGDEIFGGNERYVTNLLFEKYFLLPRALRILLMEPLLSKLPAVGPLYKASRYIRRANMRNPERFFSYNLLAERDPAKIFQPEYLSQLDTNCFINLARSHYDQAAPAHDTDRLLYIDMKFTITDNDLRKVTQMVEAAGVRVRYPLLDRNLVDFTATIPPTFKVKPGKNRYIFKQAMEGFLPHEIIKKTKHGMGLPIALWFKTYPGLSEMLNDTLFSGVPRITEYVRPEFINKMKSAFEADNTSYYGDNLWVLLMLELWLRKE